VASIKYDNSDVEAGGAGEQPQPGVYSGKVVSVTDRRPEKNDLEVVVDIGPDYARLWSYINFGESSKWKFREFTDALDLPPKGAFDPKKLEGKPVNIKVSPDEFQGEYKGRVKTWLKPGEGDEPEGAGEGEDYSDWSLDDLVAEIEARELDMPSGRKTEAKLITVLEEDDEANAGDEPEDDPEEPEAETTDDYDEWSADDLKEEIEKRELGGNISGRKTNQKMIDALRADDAGPNGDEPDAEPDEPEDDYDEWPENELEDELKDRKIDLPKKPGGRGGPAKYKTALIEALREDDAEEPF